MFLYFMLFTSTFFNLHQFIYIVNPSNNIHNFIYINFFTSLSCLKCLFLPSHLPTSALSVLGSDTTDGVKNLTEDCVHLKNGYENVDVLLLFWINFFLVLLNYLFQFLVVGHKLLCQQNPDFDLRQTNKGECCSATIKHLVKL